MSLLLAHETDVYENRLPVNIRLDVLEGTTHEELDKQKKRHRWMEQRAKVCTLDYFVVSQTSCPPPLWILLARSPSGVL